MAPTNERTLRMILVGAVILSLLYLFLKPLNKKEVISYSVTSTPPQVVYVEKPREAEDGLLRSMLSPGLKWCEQNQWLKTYDMAHVAELEKKWLGWSMGGMMRMYDMHTAYQYSSMVHPEAPCRENGFEMTYRSKTGLLLRDMDIVADHKNLMSCPSGEEYFGIKQICGLEKTFPKAAGKPCIIYSLGSRNNFEFEDAVVARTSCTIHIFDCTSEPPANDHGGRLIFHKKCVGRQDPEGRNLQLKIFPLVTVPRPYGDDPDKSPLKTMRVDSYHDLMRSLNHTHIDLLKMDVEGGEYGVFADLFSQPAEMRKTLPDQVVFESHWWHRDISHAMLTQQMFADLWRNGYRPVSIDEQEDATCYEWTVIRAFC